MKRDLPRVVAAAERERLADMALRAAEPGAVVALFADGEQLNADRVAELLARCLAGEQVQLEIDLLSYEQKPGEQNRKFVRVRDGAMMALGRSGAGTPFLRDHMQWDVGARGGTVHSSRTEKLGDGHYVVRQKATLTAPWVVELALRGLLGPVSVGLRATGPVECSLCGTEIFTTCWHCPGDIVPSEAPGAPDDVVEWVYTAAELRETSVCNVPAVPTARIESIRAAMSAALSSGAPPRQENRMKNFAALVAMLSLAPTAGEDEVLSAVEDLKKRAGGAGVDAADLKIARAELATARTELATYREGKRKADEDSFIADALSTGRILPTHEAAWRDLFAADSKRANERLAEIPEGSASPVGKPRQSDKGAGAKVETSGQVLAVSSLISKYNPAASFDGVAKVLANMGFANAKDMVVEHLSKEL